MIGRLFAFASVSFCEFEKICRVRCSSISQRNVELVGNDRNSYIFKLYSSVFFPSWAGPFLNWQVSLFRLRVSHHFSVSYNDTDFFAEFHIVFSLETIKNFTLTFIILLLNSLIHQFLPLNAGSLSFSNCWLHIFLSKSFPPEHHPPSHNNITLFLNSSQIDGSMWFWTVFSPTLFFQSDKMTNHQNLFFETPP